LWFQLVCLLVVICDNCADLDPDNDNDDDVDSDESDSILETNGNANWGELKSTSSAWQIEIEFKQKQKQKRIETNLLLWKVDILTNTRIQLPSNQTSRVDRNYNGKTQSKRSKINKLEQNEVWIFKFSTFCFIWLHVKVKAYVLRKQL
jgi:hypothetical protein